MEWKEKLPPPAQVGNQGAPDSLPGGPRCAGLGADGRSGSVEFLGTPAFCLSSPWSTVQLLPVVVSRMGTF